MTTQTAEIENWLRIRVRFFTNLTPGPDPGPKEKRRVLPESTPTIRIRYHLCLTCENDCLGRVASTGFKLHIRLPWWRKKRSFLGAFTRALKSHQSTKEISGKKHLVLIVEKPWVLTLVHVISKMRGTQYKFAAER